MSARGLLAAGLALAAFAQPRVIEPIAPAELFGGERITWNLERHFAGDGLRFVAQSSDPTLARATVDGSLLHVAANADGRDGGVVVAVTATGENGAGGETSESAQIAIHLTILPNRAFQRAWRLALPNAAPTTPRLPSGEQKLALVDAQPAPGATVDPTFRNLNIVHLGSADMTFRYRAPCRGVAVRRSLAGAVRGNGQDTQLIDHRLHCELGENAHQSVAVAVEDSADQNEAILEFRSAGASTTARLNVLESLDILAADVNGLFGRFFLETVLDAIDSRTTRVLAAVLIDRIARNALPRLRDPEARYDVTALRVAYASRSPAGEPSDQLTGLVAMPNISASGFRRRDRVVVLSHATGATPSEFAFTDTWFVLANMIAGRGYLVIAPDNWGRGGTKDQPETYLLANRTANNSLDLIDAVLADERFNAFHSAAETDGHADIALFGYSQGGHSALALWLALEARPDDIEVRELYSGGAPYDLQRTFRGALQYVDGSCDDSPWCRYIDDSVLPYATGRILPAVLTYTRTGLSAADVRDGETLSADFASGMLAGEARFDRLNSVLALNSFANLADLGTAIQSRTRINLFHSRYDRLVPYENTRQLAALLGADFDVYFHEGECNTESYEALFALLLEARGSVGALHAICGMEVADEVLRALP